MSIAKIRERTGTLKLVRVPLQFCQASQWVHTRAACGISFAQYLHVFTRADGILSLSF